MARPQKKLDFWLWAKVLVVGFMPIFPFYLFCTLIIRSFFSKNTTGFTLEDCIQLFTKKYYYNTPGRSSFVFAVTVLTTLVVGVPIAYVMSRYNVAKKRFIHIFVIMSPMGLSFIGAYSRITLFGRSSLITSLFVNISIHLPNIYGKTGIIIVSTFKLFLYVYLHTSGAMGSIDSSLKKTAENLRSDKFRRLWAITLPAVLPFIVVGAITVFITSPADSGTPMLIGEDYMVLPVLVCNEYMSKVGDGAHLANALSVIIVPCSAIVLPVRKYYAFRGSYATTAMHPPKEKVSRGFRRLMVTFPVMLVTFVGILPQTVVLTISSIKHDFTGLQKRLNLDSYITIFNRLQTNIRGTSVFSTIATTFIIVLSMLVPHIVVRQKGAAGQLMGLIIMSPFVTPGAVLGTSLIAAFNKPSVILTDTVLIIVTAFVIKKLPYTARSGGTFLQQMDPSMEEISISLGMSPTKTFGEMAVGLAVPGALPGAILNWIICINELSSSVMPYGGKTSAASAATYTEVVRNNYDIAAALASILTVSMVVILLIFLKMSKGKASIV